MPSPTRTHLCCKHTDTVLTHSWLRSTVPQKPHVTEVNVTYPFEQGKAAVLQPALEKGSELLAGGDSPECKPP